jgi:hypothetical protein
MTERIQEVLLWCLLINSGLLFCWFTFFIWGHDFMYRLHSKWFNMSSDRFDAIHYSAMGLFKLAIIVLNIAPYVALHLAE